MLKEGRMSILASAAALIVTCQTCGSFNGASAEEQILLRVENTERNFRDETAPAASYNAYDIVPNSFNTPLYGEPLMMPDLKSAPIEIADGVMADLSGNALQPQFSSLNTSGSDAVENYKAQRKLARLTQPMEIERDFGGIVEFSASGSRTGLDFDVGFAPRFHMQTEGGFRSRRVGAEVRLGQTIDTSGDWEASGWYFFAGADGEALVWEGGEARFGEVAVRDQITVGDMQAGFALHRGGGELSLSYIRREIQYSDRNGGFSTNEDFAGVSYTLIH